MKKKKDSFLGQLIPGLLFLIPSSFMLYITISGVEKLELGLMTGLLCFFLLGVIFIIKSFGYIGKKDNSKLNMICTTLVIVTVIICLLIISVNQLVLSIKIKQNGKETTATVYKVDKEEVRETYEDSEGNTRYRTVYECNNYIEYTVDEQRYTNQLSSSSCKYKRGDKKTITYDKNNPNEMIEDNNVLLLSLVVLSIIIGGTIFIYTCFKETKLKKERKKE